MIFAKKDPPPKNYRRYQQGFEYMFILSKGRPITFNGIKTLCKNRGKKRYGTYRHDKKGKLTKLNTTGYVSEEKLITNVWLYNVDNNSITNDEEAHEHSAIFPEQLVEDHLKTWSNKDDIILDIFMGSGTVAKMAYLNNRNYIGFEISKKYCNIAEQRLRKYISTNSKQVALKFPRSTYYKALVRIPSKRHLKIKKLKAEIKQIWTESKSRYGAPKIHKTLISSGIKVSLKRVQRYEFNEYQIYSC